MINKHTLLTTKRGIMALNINHDIIDNEALLPHRDDPEVRNKLIMHNLRFVRNIANKFDAYDEDIMSEGMIGLMKAIDKFDPEKGKKFTTYAHAYVSGAIMDYYNRLAYDHPGEFSANTILTSMYDPEYEEEFIDTIIDDHDMEEQMINEHDHNTKMAYVRQYLTRLSDKDREVFDMYISGMSQNEIKDHFNVSRESIRKSIIKTQEKLKKNITLESYKF